LSTFLRGSRLADNPDATLLRRRARRRLVGAIALVVLVVVLLPIVLDQQPRPVTQTLTVQIPSQDAGPFNTRVLPPLPSPPEVPKSGESARAAQDKSGTSAGPAPADSRSGVPQSAKPAERTRKDVAETRRAAPRPKEEVYMVPLGAFTNSDNAKQVRDKAASAGIKSYAESVKLPQGEQTRVRAGPFASRDAAEKARDTLKSLGLEVGQVAQR
jgi:DedD protein